MRQIPKLVSLFSLVSPMLAACSLTQPNFYEMSDEELVSYNQTVMGSEQVSCIELQPDPSRSSERFCGTQQELERRLEPQSPGARQNTSTSFNPILESRSTNPPLAPTSTRPRIQQ
jgi:hypothetical protein